MSRFTRVNVFVIGVVTLHLCGRAESSSGISRDSLDKIIEHVNSAGAHWEAGHNFDDIDQSMIQHMVGTEHVDHDPPEIKRVEHLHPHSPQDGDGMNHADEFNGLVEWAKKCPSVTRIDNQGKCASDWALVPASVISDRICLFYNGTQSPQISPHEPLSCCKTCGWGCRKGYPQMVYQQYVTKGLVTGGAYKSKQGCQPYEIKPCHGNLKTCFMAGKYETPKCKPYCYNSHYKTKYAEDRQKGEVAFRFCCPCCSAGELAEHGPLSATMKVYEDFLTYKSGVYHHVTGKHLGFLTVKLVGFNDKADPKYWIGVNSWGKRWGQNGTFKIKRLVDECMIEGSLRAVLVKDSSSEEN